MFPLAKSLRACLEFETLEDRVVPSVTAPDVDLSTHGSIGTINDAIFRQFDAQPTGTGVINSFVRLQAPNAKVAVQQGYNTDGRPLQFDENKSPVFTRSLQLQDVPVVNIGGQLYREFLLDINQKASQPFLSLDDLKVFVGGQGNLTGYSAGQLNGLGAVYDMDLGGDHWVKLDARLNQGSGKGDMLFYVPESAFAGYAGTDYVYLYSKFGVNYTANAGFEEWATAKSSLTTDSSSIRGTVVDQNGVPMVDIVVFLDSNGNGILDQNEVYTVTDASGQYSFDNLASGLGAFSTYQVRELPPDGYTEITFVPSVTLTNGGQIVLLDTIINTLIDTGGGGGGGDGGGSTIPPQS